MIEEGEISPESVLAISSYEERGLIEKTVVDRGYRFPVGLDQQGIISSQYGVKGTPTIVFLRGDRSIEWITTGLSPLLSLRIKRFLMPNQ
jgi:hypothetical protein